MNLLRRLLRSRFLVAAVVSFSPAAHVLANGHRIIDPEHSAITVHVGKSGLFRAFADDHEIRGPVKEGVVDEDAPAVDVVFDARGLRVLDPQLSPKDRAEVQTRMLSADVLDVDRYPEIRFVSSTAEKTPQGWIVRGQLMLHGHTEPVTVGVTRHDDHYTGSLRVKQTDFGMRPITVAGGAVKVKDEVKIDFDIVTRAE